MRLSGNALAAKCSADQVGLILCAARKPDTLFQFNKVSSLKQSTGYLYLTGVLELFGGVAISWSVRSDSGVSAVQ